MNIPVPILTIGPVYLSKGDQPIPAPPGFPTWIIPALIGGAVLIALLTWGIATYRARAAREINDHAFRALARSLRLPRYTRQLIQRLAFHHGEASPLALLLSDHALRTALAGMEKSSPSKRDLKAIEQLRTSFALVPA